MSHHARRKSRANAVDILSLVTEGAARNAGYLFPARRGLTVPGDVSLFISDCDILLQRTSP